ncbi:unnamed protein product, partial [Schistocephalus solidus]|uniref:BACK domain-containing protein n=1 Tax=Schistocephalus solidus TaxID=70667 RepID=A0A183THC0_SCHSO
LQYSPPPPPPPHQHILFLPILLQHFITPSQPIIFHFLFILSYLPLVLFSSFFLDVMDGGRLHAHRILLAARIPSLRAALSRSLRKGNTVLSLTAENLAPTWAFASSLKIESLMETCIHLMQTQFKSFVCTDLFVNLPADTVLSLLRSDDLTVDSEEEVFAAISNWAGPGTEDVNERLKVHAPMMLREVRWLQTTAEFRNRLMESHPMFQNNFGCSRLMNLVVQWMNCADKDKLSCPFNRNRRPPQTFLIFGADKNQKGWLVLSFDSDLQREERVADMIWHHNATYSVVGGSIFEIGGDYSTTVEEFLTKERRWRQRAPLTVGRSMHAAAVMKVEAEGGEKALIGVFGGRKRTYLSSCEVYDVSQDRWSKLPDLRTKRCGTAAASLPGDSRVFVFGGCNDSGRLASVDVCRLRGDWQEKMTSAGTADFWWPAARMRTARSGHAATPFRGKILIAGGNDGQKDLNTVEMFSPPDVTCPRGQWTKLAPMKETRRDFCLLTSPDAVFALGGNAHSCALL